MSRPGVAAAVPAMGGYNTTDGEKPRIVLFIQAHGVCPLEGAANTRSETMIPEGMNLRVFSIPGANNQYNPGLMGVIQPNTFPAHPEFEGKSIDMSFPSILARNLRKQPFSTAWADLKEETEEVYNVSGQGDELRAVGDPFTDIPNVAEPRYFQFNPNCGENTSETGTRAMPVNTVRELYGVFIADSNMPDIVASNLPFTTISEADLGLDPINRTEAGSAEPEHLFVEPKYMNARNMVSRAGGDSIGGQHFLKLIADQTCHPEVKRQAILKLNHMWMTRSSTLAHILDVFSVFLFDSDTGELIEGGIDLFVVDPTCRGANTDFMCRRSMTEPAEVMDSFEFSSQPDLSAPPAGAAAPPAALAPPPAAPPAALAPPPALAPAQASSRTSPRRSRHGRSHAPSRIRRGRSRSRSSSASSSSSSPGRAHGSSQRRNGNSRNRGRGRGQGAARGGVPQAGGNKEHLSISNSGGGYRRTKRKSRHNQTKHRVRRIVNITKRTATKRRR